MSLANFVAHTDLRMKQEEERCKRYGFSRDDVMNGVQELIVKIYVDLLDSGFKELVEKNDIDSLRTLHRFMTITGEQNCMAKYWADYIRVLLFSDLELIYRKKEHN